jgi:chromosome segregation ATPase
MRKLIGCIFVLAPLLIPVSAIAQTPNAERQTLQTLLVEVQQLRAAIERSTLLGTRTQIVMQRIQIQEARTARLSQEVDRVRREIAELERAKPEMAAQVRALEERLAPTTDPNGRLAMEAEVKHTKLRLEQLGAQEQQTRAREADLANQLQTEQGRLTELHDRVNTMERALDAAIGQMTGQH